MSQNWVKHIWFVLAWTFFNISEFVYMFVYNFACAQLFFDISSACLICLLQNVSQEMLLPCENELAFIQLVRVLIHATLVVIVRRSKSISVLLL